MASIEDKARAEAKKLMSEVGKLQAKANSQNLANKAETDKLIAEINRLQVAAIKERDSEKAKLAKAETKRLYQEQLDHISQRQRNTREQLNRLMQAKQKYDLLHEKAEVETTAKDQQLHQQLGQLIQRKKEEYVQLSKEAEFIRQRAKQKGFGLDVTQEAAPEPREETKPAPRGGSTTDRAKAEAERLISEVRAPLKADTSEKAEEVSKLIAEISKLQSAADKGQLSEEEAKDLESRIMRIESKQRQARDQINQLTQAKIKYELALARATQEKSAEKERQEQDEKLQEELNELIKNKEDEQSKLMEELKAIKSRAEEEAAMLKAQRDAARALAEQQASGEGKDYFPGGQKNFWLSIAISLVVLILGGGIGIFFLTPWFDQWLGQTGDPRPPRAETERAGGPAEREAPAETEQPGQPVVEEAPKQVLEAIRVYRDRLKSGGQGPVMIQVPGGEFEMGAPPHLPYSNERPQVKIKLRSFSISKYEITFHEYREFARATGAKLPNDRNWGRANRPVINVSWHDATAYTQWLTTQTGHQYRLPSEREWEYAARAGTQTLYWWGNDLEKNKANCAVCGGQWDNAMTAPVGSFPPNPLGLQDVLGNVQEWTLSCYHPNYRGAPEAGQIWEGGDCGRRVVRGGAYNTYENDLRISKRLKYNPNAQSDNLGFRILRVD